ncbi:hypothetical protein [Sphingomonas sp. 37zxx]|uniref:hypothetical protein n=1 Tax=Sphingomonas sp. 37zxx TaxID=1550073 RepID=UPI000A8B17A5|nr:hypothetical protein [Sphingomonas sp. 37zxx]
MTTVTDMPRAGWLRRGDIALRTLAAVPLGYAVSSLWGMALARILPMARAEASITGGLVALALCAVAAMYAFAARSGVRAVIVLTLLGAVAGAITWMSIAAGGRA